ncbi:hypothetical protein AM274_31115 [Pseudomonas nunensis]|nr:hypothetical protein AM274_31115 [Pseudomonas nunensis]
MHVTTGCYSISKALFFSRGQPFETNGRCCHNEHDQIGMAYQRISPSNRRTGQHPVFFTEILLHQ